MSRIAPGLPRGVLRKQWGSSLSGVIKQQNHNQGTPWVKLHLTHGTISMITELMLIQQGNESHSKGSGRNKGILGKNTSINFGYPSVSDAYISSADQVVLIMLLLQVAVCLYRVLLTWPSVSKSRPGHLQFHSTQILTYFHILC